MEVCAVNGSVFKDRMKEKRRKRITGEKRGRRGRGEEEWRERRSKEEEEACLQVKLLLQALSKDT